MDWLDQRRRDVWRFYMVSQNNPSKVVGELRGVDLSNSSISAAYYTDTRTEGTLTLVNGNYVRGRFIRVVHEVPEWGYQRTLGTYVVTGDDAVRSNNEWITTLQLNSLFYAMHQDKAARPWTVKKNASILSAMKQDLDWSKRPYVAKDALDKVAKTPIVFEGGTTMMERLYTLCSLTKNRLDLDGFGNVVIAPYVNPSKKVPVMTLDHEARRGILHDEVSRSSDYLRVPSRVVVSVKYTEQDKDNKSVEKEIIGIADANGEFSRGTRGYRVTDYRDEPDMSPKTAERANALAASYLSKSGREHLSWDVTSQFFPVWEGDTVWLWVRDGEQRYQGRHKCLVQNLEINFEPLTMRMTLRDTSSGDTGEAY